MNDEKKAEAPPQTEQEEFRQRVISDLKRTRVIVNDAPQWAVEAAKEVNSINESRNHVLRDRKGFAAPVMPTDEMAAIIARHASEREKTLERERDEYKEAFQTDNKVLAETIFENKELVERAERAEAEVASLNRELNEWRASDTAELIKRHNQELHSEQERRVVAQEACVKLNAEVASLRQSLTKYNADHLKWCAKYNDPKYGPMAYPSPDVECTCGFSVLLAGKGDTL